MTRHRILRYTQATVALVALLVAMSCTGGGSAQGIRIDSPTSFSPQPLALKQVTLKLAGTKYTADTRVSGAAGVQKIDLMAFGQVIESEEYRLSDRAFSVSDAGGERYEPPIDLIRYPMRVGDGWHWEGEIRTGPAGHRAQAKVSTASEDLTMKGETLHNVLRVEVELAIDSGIPSQPSKRMLRFEITPSMGVIKRAFGDYSVRGPVDE